MEPFTRLTSVMVPLPMANIDTDQIIPARFMRKSRADGYGDYLLRDLRFDGDGRLRDDSTLDQPAYQGARILVAGRNFGGGSSREAAVYALVDFGFRCVIAPNFGDIFTSNAVKNGLLPARLEAACVDRLLRAAAERPGRCLTVDLPNQRVHLGRTALPFEILANHKAQLIAGWDDIDLTRRHAETIAHWVDADRAKRPWAIPRR